MSTVDTQRVQVSVADHVATVTLSRPDKHNALDRAMFEGIAAAAAEVRGTAGVRAVVLHGDGPSFCSGLDIASILADGPDGFEFLNDRSGPRNANLAQRVSTDWLDLPFPVIAAVHGNCFGGGLQIALGADIRIAAPDAKLSVMEARWGLVPDMGITQSLPRLVGLDHAKELTFTARRVSGEEAAAIGLVTRCAADPLAAAQELAAEIAAKSPDAVRAAKKLYEETWPAATGNALQLETDLQIGLMGSPNQLEAVRSGFAKEPGNFTDPA
jgi:enoyl-CoA hydratase/carnithine racemase